MKSLANSVAPFFGRVVGLVECVGQRYQNNAENHVPATYRRSEPDIMEIGRPMMAASISPSLLVVNES